jgi:hypothetical protein
MSKYGVIPLLGKVGKFSMFVVFGASSVSTGIKAQISNRPATLICPETGNFPVAHP